MRTIIILTSQEDRTAELVEAELSRTSTEFLRLDTETFGSSVTAEFSSSSSGASFILRVGPRTLRDSDIGSIWYRRPLPPEPVAELVDGHAREFATEELSALLYGCLYSLDVLWVSWPPAIRVASHKPHQIWLAQQLGFSVPQTLISQDPSSIREFAQSLTRSGRRMCAKLVAKGPPRAAVPEEQYCVYTHVMEKHDLREDAALSCCPAIYQEYVEKLYELRVTVVGNSVYACRIDSQASMLTSVDWRHYDFDRVNHSAVELDAALRDRCLALTRSLGLTFAAIDLIIREDGTAVFLEVNPNGQWGWIEELTGMPIARAIADLLARRTDS